MFVVRKDIRLVCFFICINNVLGYAVQQAPAGLSSAFPSFQNASHITTARPSASNGPESVTIQTQDPIPPSSRTQAPSQNAPTTTRSRYAWSTGGQHTGGRVPRWSKTCATGSAHVTGCTAAQGVGHVRKPDVKTPKPILAPKPSIPPGGGNGAPQPVVRPFVHVVGDPYRVAAQRLDPGRQRDRVVPVVGHALGIAARLADQILVDIGDRQRGGEG